MTHLGASDNGVIEAQLLGKATQHQALAASRRTIEQHAIDGRQLVHFGFFGVLQSKKHFLAQLFLQLIATCHIVEATARAFPNSNGRSAIVLTLSFGLRIGFILLYAFRQFGHHLLKQSLGKLGGRSETVVGSFGQSFLQDDFHIIGQLHLLRFQNEVLHSCLFHRIGNLFLVADIPQVHHLPRRLAENQEIKECACRENVALHRVDGAEGLWSTKIGHQVLDGKCRATLHHVGDVTQVDDGGHQHTIVQLLKHDV